MRARVVIVATLAVAVAACASGSARRPAAPDVNAFVARHWRQPLAPQGPPPARFSALEASLQPEACGACHPQQLADWRDSWHAAAMGPGVMGQLVEMLARAPADAVACQTCHAPLAEQKPLVREADGWRANPGFDATLRERGLACAGCHVRAHRRFGPPRRDGSLAPSAPPATLPHGGATRDPAFLASEFCRDCHQFDARGPALNGKPLEDTYNEWRASPAARAGVQCQDCHMPDRRHLWRGIHDPDTVRAGVTITLLTPRDAAAAPTLRVQNTGVGHAFPTYVTPLVLMRAEQVDAAGAVVAGSRREHRIAREVTLDLTEEIADTRLRPGEAAELRYAVALAPGARVRFSVIVYPDAFYTGFYEALLAQGAGRGESQIREALAATRRSPFTLFVQEWPAR